MSEEKLKVEDLKAMSVSQLTEYAKELDGEDKVLAETVLAAKIKRNEHLREIPGVAAEKEVSEEVNSDVETRRAEREAARLEKEVQKAKLLEDRAEAAKKREIERAAALEAKMKKAAEKVEMKTASAEQIAAQKEANEKLRAEKAAEKEAIFQSKLEAVRIKKEEENVRVAAIAEALKANPDVNLGTSKAGKTTKTSEIRELMAQGFTNPEIAKATGYGIKFVCDTAWRINQGLANAKFVEEYMAKRKAAIEGTVAQETTTE